MERSSWAAPCPAQTFPNPAQRYFWQFGSSIQDSAYIPGLEINADRKLWPGQTRDAIGGRHPNKTVNVGFVDGHVARKKASELLVEKTGEDDYDYSPLWGPK